MTGKYNVADYIKVHFDFDSLPNLLSPRKKPNLQGIGTYIKVKSGSTPIN